MEYKKIKCQGCGTLVKPDLISNVNVYYTCKKCGNTFWMSRDDYERRTKQ